MICYVTISLHVLEAGENLMLSMFTSGSNPHRMESSFDEVGSFPQLLSLCPR